ncbi:MAG: PilZ domain-containing protein [Candidatus Omnitrophota bacterium]
MPSNKRQWPRVRAQLTVQYCYLDSDKNQICWDTTAVRDLSEGGMCVTAMKSFALGEKLNFIFTLPSNPLKKIQIEGKVASCNPFISAYGELAKGIFVAHVQFCNITDEDREIIRTYIAWAIEKRN